MGDSVRISIEVTNTGQVAGEEVVQLYLRDVVRSVTPPDKTLKGFAKIMLAPGESRRVTITLAPDDLKFYNAALDFVAEPGTFEVFIGETPKMNETWSASNYSPDYSCQVRYTGTILAASIRA